MTKELAIDLAIGLPVAAVMAFILGHWMFFVA